MSQKENTEMTNKHMKRCPTYQNQETAEQTAGKTLFNVEWPKLNADNHQH